MLLTVTWQTTSPFAWALIVVLLSLSWFIIKRSARPAPPPVRRCKACNELVTPGQWEYCDRFGICPRHLFDRDKTSCK